MLPTSGHLSGASVDPVVDITVVVVTVTVGIDTVVVGVVANVELGT